MSVAAAGPGGELSEGVIGGLRGFFWLFLWVRYVSLGGETSRRTALTKSSKLRVVGPDGQFVLAVAGGKSQARLYHSGICISACMEPD